MNWNGLERIENIEQLSPEDQRVIEEVRAVLERLGALSRFGLTLNHSHFEMEDDEILVERVDSANRTLTTTVEKASDHGSDQLVPTSWRLDGSQHAALVYCWRPPNSQFHAQ